MPKFTTPRSATPGNADPSGSRMRLHAAKPTRRIPAIAKRRPAPQKGGSSRLLKRTATKFVPPIRTTATNTERTAVDGRFITPTIRVSARPYPWPMASRRGATVELREVTKRYGDTVAVDHLSLTAPAGRGGQRVGVARAMAAEPPLMLMDEPFGAVDPIVRERLQNEFLSLQRAQGITVIFVTHDIDEAIKLGDRVAIMRAGKLVQYAPTGELLARPADDFVAQLLGTDSGLKRIALLNCDTVEYDPNLDS